MTIQTDQRIATDRDVNLNAVSPAFFATLGIRIVAGRDFDERDSRPVGETGARSAIVNEAFVKRYLRGRSPLGVRICEGSGPDAKPNVEVVGVVGGFQLSRSTRRVGTGVLPDFRRQRCCRQFLPEGSRHASRHVSIDSDNHSQRYPALPITYFRTLDEQVDRSLNTERMLATLSGSFGMLALLLSLVGLYGVMSFVVTQRRHEIGIRIALGATGRSAMWLLLRDAIAMIIAGHSYRGAVRRGARSAGGVAVTPNN